jgi:hypothetical protein
MSGVNQIIQTFEGLGEGDRETTMKALSTMMRAESQRQPAKKKVNGFMGFRGTFDVCLNFPYGSDVIQHTTRRSSPSSRRKRSRPS